MGDGAFPRLNGRSPSPRTVNRSWCGATSRGSNRGRGGRGSSSRSASSRSSRSLPVSRGASRHPGARAHVLGGAAAHRRELVGGRAHAAEPDHGASLLGRRRRARRVRALPRGRATRRATSAPFVLVAAVVFVVAGGVGDVSTWFRSQLPSTLPAGTVRALVALAFGGGIGLIIAAATHLAPDHARTGARRSHLSHDRRVRVWSGRTARRYGRSRPHRTAFGHGRVWPWRCNQRGLVRLCHHDGGDGGGAGWRGRAEQTDHALAAVYRSRSGALVEHHAPALARRTARA